MSYLQLDRWYFAHESSSARCYPFALALARRSGKLLCGHMWIHNCHAGYPLRSCLSFSLPSEVDLLKALRLAVNIARRLRWVVTGRCLRLASKRTRQLIAQTANVESYVLMNQGRRWRCGCAYLYCYHLFCTLTNIYRLVHWRTLERKLNVFPWKTKMNPNMVKFFQSLVQLSLPKIWLVVLCTN